MILISILYQQYNRSGTIYEMVCTMLGDILQMERLNVLLENTIFDIILIGQECFMLKKYLYNGLIKFVIIILMLRY